MKELTTIMKIQITAISDVSDEQCEDWAQNKEAKIKGFLDTMKAGLELDDVTLLQVKDFIMEKAK